MSVGPIAQAIAEVAKVIGNWQNSKDRRKMKAAIEAAEKFIQVSGRDGEFKELTTKKRQQFLTHYRKRFFRYNQ